ncbi:hypothetical protein PLICRDRAFT_701809 [Plicaturopsis crispa FD-325 SS-3]|uniref:Uncharacterized protein n=1 Tax=Plicaturopsis crispa FD-325 SS-3 TaxID=944288 RepID=A0A0C9T8U7_PLICR|nr:hypothetical protein PLICRDRAFT_701809 [Plicaturopsis crispa FD-325 SS-3]
MATKVSSTGDVLLYFLAILLPPVSVFFSTSRAFRCLMNPDRRMLTNDLRARMCSRSVRSDFWINICLTIAGWIPGVIHAWYIISRSEGAM